MNLRMPGDARLAANIEASWKKFDASFANRERHKKATHLARICNEVADAHGLTVDDLYGRGRTKRVVMARQEAYYRIATFWRQSGGWAFSSLEIGSHFSRDHTTVLYGIHAHAMRNGIKYVSRSGLTEQERAFRAVRKKRTSKKALAKPGRIKSRAGKTTEPKLPKAVVARPPAPVSFEQLLRRRMRLNGGELA